MKREYLLLLFLAALLAGCGDDVSANDDENDGATPTTMTDERDGQVYRIITIGEQVWMAENLNYEYKVDSVVYGNWSSVLDPSGKSDSSARYGRFYTWAAAMDTATTGCGDSTVCEKSAAQGICPDGWHLPSEWDWMVLFISVGGDPVAGTALRASSGWGGNYTDAYGFSALPTGHRALDGEISFANDEASFWSSNDGPKDAVRMQIFDLEPSASIVPGNKDEGYSVRCVRDW